MQSLPEPLAPVQQKVLTMLATGSSVTAAAVSTGIHRNTISNWRRSSETFRAHWASAQHDQAMFWRDELQACADLAVEALVSLLKDEKTPPSVRLRAALAVLDKVTTPAPLEPDPKSSGPHPLPPDNLLELPKHAQPSCTHSDDPAPAARTAHDKLQAPRPVHNSAQSRTSILAGMVLPRLPRLGRNTLCPCGSGEKFKRCCLAKSIAA